MSERTLMQVPREVFKKAMPLLQKALQCQTRKTTQRKHIVKCRLFADDGTWWECELNMMSRYSSGGAIYARRYRDSWAPDPERTFQNFVEAICQQLIQEVDSDEAELSTAKY